MDRGCPISHLTLCSGLFGHALILINKCLLSQKKKKKGLSNIYTTLYRKRARERENEKDTIVEKQLTS